MKQLKELFDNNKRWVGKQLENDPEFFVRLSNLQKPKYLWIGCSDSRVPANEIVGLKPGELFVHRNVANMVVHTDMNCLSVLQYAIEVLQVRHIIVCGHYGCGGVQTAIADDQLGLIDNWLRHIQDVYRVHEPELVAISDHNQKLRRLCELNIMEQVYNTCYTSFVQNAWDTGRELSVHGWIYDINDGLLRDLDTTISAKNQIPQVYRFMKQK